MEFKDRLKKLREENNLLQKDIAEMLSVDRSTITAYETGRREPNIKKIILLSKIFNCSIDYLFGTTEIKHKIISHNKTDGAYNFVIKLKEMINDIEV